MFLDQELLDPESLVRRTVSTIHPTMAGKRREPVTLSKGSFTSILSRVKQITSPGWMHETSAQRWEDPEGWDGEGGGRRDWDGEHM